MSLTTIIIIENIISMIIFMMNFAWGIIVERFFLMFFTLYLIIKFFVEYIPKNIIITSLIGLVIRSVILYFFSFVGLSGIAEKYGGTIAIFGLGLGVVYFYMILGFVALLLIINLVKFIIKFIIDYLRGTLN